MNTIFFFFPCLANRRSEDNVAPSDWWHVSGTTGRRVRRMRELHQTASISTSAWRHVRTPISPFFAVVSRSAADLPICGFLFLDRCLNAVDLKLGSSGGAVNVSEDSCRVWGRVSAWICLIFPRFCRLMEDLLFYGSGWLNWVGRQWIWSFVVAVHGRNFFFEWWKGIGFMGLWDAEVERTKLLVRALGLWYHVENLNLIEIIMEINIIERDEENGG